MTATGQREASQASNIVLFCLNILPYSKPLFRTVCSTFRRIDLRKQWTECSSRSGRRMADDQLKIFVLAFNRVALWKPSFFRQLSLHKALTLMTWRLQNLKTVSKPQVASASSCAHQTRNQRGVLSWELELLQLPGPGRLFQCRNLQLHQFCQLRSTEDQNSPCFSEDQFRPTIVCMRYATFALKQIHGIWMYLVCFTSVLKSLSIWRMEPSRSKMLGLVVC